jgi:hypothetical protein
MLQWARGIAMKRAIVGLIICALTGAGSAGAADRRYQGDLDPFPHDNSTRDAVVGTGTVSATLTGNMLAVAGRFAGLSSPATAAHLQVGMAMGVPGPKIGELNVTQARDGEISGSVKLAPAAIAALNKGGLYVQLDSVNAADGNSWGWLENLDAPRP